jgi:hypothetical protein
MYFSHRCQTRMKMMYYVMCCTVFTVAFLVSECAFYETLFNIILFSSIISASFPRPIFLSLTIGRRHHHHHHHRHHHHHHHHVQIPVY